MTDEQVRRIALFFQFSVMDERVAMHAAHATIAELKVTQKQKSTIPAAELIRVLWSKFQTHRKLLPRNRPHEAPEKTWQLSPDVDIQAWSRFQKDSADSEIVAVVLSHILKFEPVDIASGLGITIGTARYRIGKGVRQLGAQVEKMNSVRA